MESEFVRKFDRTKLVGYEGVNSWPACKSVTFITSSEATTGSFGAHCYAAETAATAISSLASFLFESSALGAAAIYGGSLLIFHRYALAKSMDEMIEPMGESISNRRLEELLAGLSSIQNS